MSFRTAYGYSRSENGWRMVNRDACVVAGPSVGLATMNTAPIRAGDASTILVAWALWYHRNVEPLRSPVWGWSAENAVGDSNHLSGTALDFNAPQYPWGYRTMPGNRKALVRRGLALFEGVIYWGADWNRADEMHYQLAYPEGDHRISAFAAKLNAGHLGLYRTTEKDDDDMTENDRKMLREIWTQLLGPNGRGWPQLGQNDKGQNLTLVDALAEHRKSAEAAQ